MEVTIKAGDSLQIPEGFKAVIKDNVVTFEKLFQNGDILCSIFSGNILIFKSYDEDGFSSHYNVDGEENSLWVTDSFRCATEKEKQTLFDKMKEQGLRWNAEGKRIETIRWRAEDDKEYYYVGNQGLLMVDKEDGDCADENRYKFNNYFRTIEQVEEAAKRVNETLRKYHEEIGE